VVANFTGFWIRKLSVTGPKVRPAEIGFSQGLNVVSGLSNTGKSYIFDCINFVLGAKDPPASITESAEYSLVSLEIVEQNETVYTLERSLQGGSIGVTGGKYEEQKVLAPQHAKKKESISSFLLERCGIQTDGKLRKSKAGKLVSLTFRTFAHNFLVDETSIQAKSSPILTANKANITLDTSAFKFLLTGVDDSSVIVKVDPVVAARKIAKREVYDYLISELEEVAEKHAIDEDALNRRSEDIEVQVESLTSSLSELSVSIHEKERDRAKFWKERRRAESSLENIEEILGRFELLRQHYNSDLTRLEFIQEGTHYFEQLEIATCPLCGTDLGQHNGHHMCGDDKQGWQSIAAASTEEAKKIRVHLSDLESTVRELETEKKDAEKSFAEAASLVVDLDNEISRDIEPKVRAQKEELDKLFEERVAVNELRNTVGRLEKLRRKRAEYQEEKRGRDEETQKEELPPMELNTMYLRNLCDNISEILRKWEYEDTEPVEFDQRTKVMDIVVSGKQRKANGKGVRALMRSAFSLGLMRYCKKESKPHPRLLILDSPLTTFKEKGSEINKAGEVSREVQQAFFRNLAKAPSDEQIIILENKEPPSDLITQINYEYFSKKPGEGRPGFFPSAS
jgi:hypothetical protein